MLDDHLARLNADLQSRLARFSPSLQLRETGTLVAVNNCVAVVEGLPGVKAQELIRFGSGELGIAFDLREQNVGVVLLTTDTSLRTGVSVHRTGRVLDAPVGYPLLGRVINAYGAALDDHGDLGKLARWPVERDAPAIIDRAPVTSPLQTGIKVVDALIPVGKGQRELVLGDRQTGKTTVALDAIINQRGSDTICIYCAIGQRSASVVNVIQTLRAHDMMAQCVVVVGSGTDGPGLQYITPYAATTMAEYFMVDGRDVLLVYDDMTRHARAYRELTLLLGRTPGREAFPGDVFYLHSRLLERVTHLGPARGGGSITALPVVETEAGNIAAYIPTNLISITDGQIYLCPERFSKGQLPAVDVGKSVSRVGGKAQLPAYRAVTGELRLSYTQFEELEAFARFGTRVDAITRASLNRGRLVREVLKQTEHDVWSSSDQIVMILAVNRGRLDHLEAEQLPRVQAAIRHELGDKDPAFCHAIRGGERLSDEQQNAIIALVDRVLTDTGLAP